MRKTIQLKKFQQGILDLLFPPRCASCRKLLASHGNHGLCNSCIASVRLVKQPLCTICGKEFTTKRGQDHLCENCLRHPPSFDMIRAVAYYEDPVRNLLHRLKYSNDTTTTQPLLEIARGFDLSPFRTCEVILPVPLHKKRLKKRGLNHALILARLFFHDEKGKIYSNVLIRSRPTPSQTELDKIGRRRNVSGAFCVEHAEIIKNKKVCVVDDVYTTGATLNECARTLKQAGANQVKGLTMARVEKYSESFVNRLEINN